MAYRDYSRYELWNGRKLVYVGISNDPERRINEHDGSEKRFTTMRVIGPKVSEETARDWEQERLESYRRNHNGRNLKHNKT
ncbi:MAG: hypothetical protein UBAL2_86920229 [Leptospirillum rubarum]|nr:MAG: hypothetical protein UBAL2_86920229 [Leptospirillum rubarum]